ncbi:MAG: hypothetical protein EBT92_14370 [Planctomycetes bacterium]|nr:hypothetical protein [Planctomycetota bacterium]
MTELGQITSRLLIGLLHNSACLIGGKNAVTITRGVSRGQVDLAKMGIQLVAAVMGAGGEDGGRLLDPKAREMIKLDE